MESSSNILTELQTLSPTLAGMEKVNVFTVPQGYFEGLSETVLAMIQLHSNSFSVPQGYFDTLADNILQKIKNSAFAETAAEELKNLSPELLRLQKQNVYEVPQGYFATLSDQLLNNVDAHQTKVIPLRKRNAAVIKYAVAAAFIGVMALGVFKFTGSTKSNKLDAVVLSGLQINKANTFDQELAKVSDDDILQYLATHGESIDAEVMASSIVDEKELPSQEDYWLDEKTLDKYLNN